MVQVQSIMTRMDLPTASEIPWTETCSLGVGVAAPSGELLKSAVEPFIAVNGDGRKENISSKTVTSEEQIRKLVSMDASSGFSTAAVSASAKVHVENYLSVSDHSSTIVCMGRFAWDEALASPLPHLTDEARSLYERDPAGFHEAYGHYFVAGFTKEAELTIYARITGTSRESVKKVSTEVESKIKSVGWKADANAAAALENSVHNEHCEIELDVLKSGMSDNKNSNIPGLSLTEIPAHVKDFQKRAVGTKTKAILVHYTRVEPKISTKIDTSAEMYLKANHFYESLVVARVMRGKLPKLYAENLEKLLKNIEDDTQIFVPRDLSGDINKLDELSDRIENWISDVKTLKLYQRIWREAAAVPGSKNGDRWGLTSWNDPELSGLDIKSKIGSLRKAYSEPGWERGTLRIDVKNGDKDRKICGIELIANKGDNGYHQLSDGGLNQNFADFYFKSEYDRGFNWTVKVWSIPAEMANFLPEDM